jgi:predicted porin
VKKPILAAALVALTASAAHAAPVYGTAAALSGSRSESLEEFVTDRDLHRALKLFENNG